MKNWNQLRYFNPSEFIRNGIDFSNMMAPIFMLALDELRHKTGARIMISPHPYALGRSDEKYATSQHYIPLLQQGAPDVLSVADLIPYHRTSDNKKLCLSRTEIYDFVEAAEDLGFTGIGVYPHWVPAPGVHLDMRTRLPKQGPATWAGIKESQNYDGVIRYTQVYKGLDSGLAIWPNDPQPFTG